MSYATSRVLSNRSSMNWPQCSYFALSSSYVTDSNQLYRWFRDTVCCARAEERCNKKEVHTIVRDMLITDPCGCPTGSEKAVQSLISYNPWQVSICQQRSHKFQWRRERNPLVDKFTFAFVDSSSSSSSSNYWRRWPVCVKSRIFEAFSLCFCLSLSRHRARVPAGSGRIWAHKGHNLSDHCTQIIK